MRKKNEMKKFFFFMIFFILFSSIGWCYTSVSVSPIYFHTQKINDSFEILLNNQGDEPIRLSFFVNDLATKSTVRYVHFVRGNTFFLNIGESLTVPIEFSFDQSNAYLSNNFPIICEIASLKKPNSSFEPKFRMLFYVSKIDSHVTRVAADEDENELPPSP